MNETAETQQRILVADDDRHIADLVRMYLTKAGYEITIARDGNETQRLLREQPFDLAVLDIMMPGPDGLQIIRNLRKRSETPVIFLTARSSDVDKVAGLQFGADDYVTKPFNPTELVARVQSVLRRTRATAEPAGERIAIGELRMDVRNRTALIKGETVTLTPKEFDLLATFARFANITLDREKLLDLVWGTSFYGMRTVDVHIVRLRSKLEGSGLKIETVWGSGYRLVEAIPA
ncbi:MAG TPA: response regulator transcription factor [Dehalococcoidia bacterium]|nr:response regulator transcription factor [Dehalococcoidia bacterium]